MTDRNALTRTPIHPPLNARWSPRAFADRAVESGTLVALLEAARWAPSCFNDQPWYYIVGTRGDDSYDRVFRCLAEWNQKWARTAPVLMIGVARLAFERNGTANRHAMYDLGQATMSLVVEASVRGLHAHQMGGFSADAARQTFEIPDGFDPVVALAVGYIGDPAQLEAEYQELETTVRERRPLDETVFGRRWGEPSSILDPASGGRRATTPRPG